MWYAGRWFAARQQMKRENLGLLAAVAWGSTTVAFMISNGSYFLFSGNFAGINLMQYTVRIAKYYPQYLFCTMLYLACAAALHVLLVNSGKNTHHSAERV
jgi:imidazoleglycerol phosphate dehydratase HisB